MSTQTEPTTPAFTETDGWLTDANNNRARISYWGTREAAEASLRSLKNCRNCDNCSDCSGCSDCSDCSGCSDCSDCSRCSRCSDCSDCSGCSGCSDCSDCSGCSDCSDCSRCSDCSGCSDCSDCSDCSGCSDCSRCKNVAYLFDKTGISADPTVTLDVGAPPIPRIEGIHQRIYGAASQPEALNMSDWHTCKETHCRAGWTVTLAGEAGKRLEQFHNTELAAMLIYRESGYHINPARFYDKNDAALEDMKRLAETEAAAS